MTRLSTLGLLAALALASCTAKTTEPAADATGSTPPGSTTTTTATTADPAQLAGEWRIQTLNGAALPAATDADATPMLNFDVATGKVAGSTGCNRLMGTYAVNGAGITFGPLATTRMACPPNSPEAGLLAALGSQTLTYQLSGNQLTLLDNNKAVMTLSR